MRKIEKKSNTWYRIFRGEETRTDGFDILNVFKDSEESRNAFKKRVGYYSGYRDKFPKSVFDDGFRYRKRKKDNDDIF